MLAAYLCGSLEGASGGKHAQEGSPQFVLEALSSEMGGASPSSEDSRSTPLLLLGEGSSAGGSADGSSAEPSADHGESVPLASQFGAGDKPPMSSGVSGVEGLEGDAAGSVAIDAAVNASPWPYADPVRRRVALRVSWSQGLVRNREQLAEAVCRGRFTAAEALHRMTDGLPNTKLARPPARDCNAAAGHAARPGPACGRHYAGGA